MGLSLCFCPPQSYCEDFLPFTMAFCIAIALAGLATTGRETSETGNSTQASYTSRFFF